MVSDTSTTSSCSKNGPAFRGNAWGFTPSVLATVGFPQGAFLGLRLAGRYLWVHGTDTPSFVDEHEAMLVFGGAFQSALPVSVPVDPARPEGVLAP